MIEVFTDGLCEPVNPGGTATWGFEIRRIGKRLHEEWGVTGAGKGMSNNVAEYQAVEKAAKWLLGNGLHTEETLFRSDSRLIVNQMNGKWKVRKGLYVAFYLLAREAVSKLASARFEWIPREENEYADSLTRRAYEEYRWPRSR